LTYNTLFRILQLEIEGRWQEVAATVTIERIDINKRDIARVKKIFSVKDNSEAVMKAVDLAAGKIELETIFEKFRGTEIRKNYA
jgi:hypothetical protein